MFRGDGLPVEVLGDAGEAGDAKSGDVRIEDVLAGSDIVLFSAGSGTARRFAPAAVAHGGVVVDNSSAFRMDSRDVPLVVPEVNAGAIASHRGIIANPNCVAIIAAVPLWPLHRAIGISRVIAATYQAASEPGRRRWRNLRSATRAPIWPDVGFSPAVLRHPRMPSICSATTPPVDPETGANEEETKVARELRKIMQTPHLPIGITCIRVPVLRAHSIALTVELARPITPAVAREILAAAPGCGSSMMRGTTLYPMPNEASGQGDVLVGRIRRDGSDPSGRSLALFVAGDQLLKGAALNAVQIAERLVA